MTGAGPVRRILIVKLSALGDVLRTTSLLRPLRERHPGAAVTWLTSPAARPLLEGNPDISEIVTMDSPTEFHAGEFDLVLSLEEDRECARLGAEACAGELVGVQVRGDRLKYTRSSALYYDMSLLNRGADGSLAQADALKAANRLTYAELWLKVLGLPAPRRREELRPVLVLSEEENRRAERTLAGWGVAPERAVGLNPGAGTRWPAKQPSETAVADLAQALSGLGRPVILFGGPDEAQRNRRILEACRRRGLRLVDAGTSNPLRDFAALIGLCRLVVTTDSLALHLANALHRPVVVLVGPTSAAELDCFHRGEKLKAPEPCSCFYQPRCRLPASCLDSIPAESVAAAARRWLK